MLILGCSSETLLIVLVDRYSPRERMERAIAASAGGGLDPAVHIKSLSLLIAYYLCFSYFTIILVLLPTNCSFTSPFIATMIKSEIVHFIKFEIENNYY